MNKYKGMTKADLIKSLEYSEKSYRDCVHALAGLYAAIQPIYVMQPDSYQSGFQDATYTPILYSTTEYNGHSESRQKFPRQELVHCVRDAVREAENVLHYGVNEVNLQDRGHMTSSSEGAIKEYRNYFMMHNGWYLNEDNSTQVQVDVRGYRFYKIDKNENDQDMPVDYVWDRNLLKWVSKDSEYSATTPKVWNSKITRETLCGGYVPKSRRI